MFGAMSRIAVMAVLSAALLAGCGHDVAGTATPPATSSKPPAVDASTLDTGKYLTLPRKLGQVASEDEGRMAEALRMAEAVADPANVDPTLVVQTAFGPLITPSDVASNISLTGQAVVAPVLAKYGMVAGRMLMVNNTTLDPSGAQQPEQDVKTIMIMLLRFPDAAAAKNAAVEMDAADFAVSPDNVPVPVTKYPAAHGHWRSTHPSMASTLAHNDFVIHLLVSNPTPNLETLTGMVEKTFDQEIPVLDQFQPTPVARIAKLPKDPYGLLGRLVDITPGTEPTLSTTVATYGPNGARQVQNEREMKDKTYATAGVDQAGVWLDQKLGGSSLLRARDHDAAITLMNQEIATDPDIDHPVDGVRGLADSKCFALKPESYKDTPGIKFECYVLYDRYVAGTYSGDEADARQRAAAQYALLAAP
ncbi:hypothetical protein C8E89_12222 [Mycolicibacterium moriokaense]|uniref:Uncharacterized protein n=2 Tax=Mycolicibacterium moriokaense TaxID=39691 RepID=A0A318HA54_9MYCO|nr:hypothetical protein C8E89_12222 [Mycolicibacterium moriokaense]